MSEASKNTVRWLLRRWYSYSLSTGKAKIFWINFRIEPWQSLWRSLRNNQLCTEKLAQHLCSSFYINKSKSLGKDLLCCLSELCFWRKRGNTCFKPSACASNHDIYLHAHRNLCTCLSCCITAIPVYLAWVWKGSKIIPILSSFTSHM